MRFKKFFRILTTFTLTAAILSLAAMPVGADYITDDEGNSISINELIDDGENIIPDTLTDKRLVERVVDNADLLTDEELEKLLEAADEVSERQGVDVAIVTSDDLAGRSTSTEFADDYFDYNGLGQGENHDGILLAISMAERDWAISTTGAAITYFTDYGQQAITDRIVPFMSSGDYYKAFDMFIEFCDDYITEGKSGNPYDVWNQPTITKKPFKEVAPSLLKKCLFISLIIGFIITLIVCIIEKRKLTSVHFKGQADDYIRKDSLKITGKSDTFLYKNTTKHYNPPSSSSGGGSSTHSGSSGISHGGSSGHF